VGVDYYRPLDGKAVELVGRFPALVAAVRDVDGDLVTAHLTYLKDGKKAPVDAPRKTLTPMTGREGCAARLMPLAGQVLGIAEGIETAIAASVLHDNVPTWAALNTTLLGKFIPPDEVLRLIVFADRDVPGMEAAWRLREALSERCAVELRLPPAQFGDWADVLEARAR
jgi:putative DNA primase/helicase